MLRTIDPTDEHTARRIVEIQRAAYAVEAALIGFDEIPQLTETVEQIRRLQPMHWTGAFDGGQLVGLIAYELHDRYGDIDRLAIDPRWARRGHGRQLLRSVPLDRAMIVSTGAENAPAVELYLSEGFERIGSIEVAPKIMLAQFRRTP